MALYVASHYKVRPLTCNKTTLIYSERLLFYTQCCVIFVNHNLLTHCFLWLQNSPNDLQMLSDAPAHHLFCLLPPVPPTQNSLPEVLAVVQVRHWDSL